MSDAALSALLRIAFRNAVAAANAEDGIAQVRVLAGGLPDAASLHEAVAEALRRGLIREPLRLPEGSLHCHWRLELTPDGVAAARALIARD